MDQTPLPKLDQQPEDLSSDDDCFKKTEVKKRDKDDRETTSAKQCSGKSDVNCALIIKKKKLSTAEVLALFNEAKDGRHDAKVIGNPPVQPKAGSVFLYKRKDEDDEKFLSDQYFGFQWDGYNKLKGGVACTYYKMTLLAEDESTTTQDGREQDTTTEKAKKPTSKRKRIDVDFKKKVYMLLNTSFTDCPFVIIHYLGDEKQYVPQAHGNCKDRSRLYTRTSKETRERIKEQVKDRSSAPIQVYEKLVRDNFKETSSRSYSDNEKYQKIDTPRNLEQIKNFKKQEQCKNRISKCEIDSVYELARSDLAKFVLKLEMIPNDVIVFAEPETLKLANQILRFSNKDKTIPQLLCYDTTFNLTDSNVSILAMKNVFMHEMPIFPVAFMIHDRRVKNVHQSFWQTMEDVLDLHLLADQVPICTDRESGIVSSIKKVIPGVNHLSCTNHITRDIKFWLPDNGGNKEDEDVLIPQITVLLDSEDATTYQHYLESFKEKWSDGFKAYFKKHLQADIFTSAKFNAKRFAAFQDHPPTSNIVESLNAVIKRRNDWKELPVDALVIKLIQMQCFYLSEFKRAATYQGKYKVNKKFEKYCQWTSPSYMYFEETDFVAAVKASLIEDSHVHPNQYVGKEKLAKMCIDMQLLRQVPDQQLWVIRAPFNPDKTYDVARSGSSRSNQREFTCTCQCQTMCYHIIAVKMSIGDIIPEGSIVCKLSVLKKKTRGIKGKLGRKKPNPMDLIANVVEADDSDLAIQNQTNYNREGPLLSGSCVQDKIDEEINEGNPFDTQQEASYYSPLRFENADQEDAFGTMFLRKLLPPLKNETAAFEKYPTLKSGWLEGSIIDKVIKRIIQKYSLSYVFYLEEVICQTVRESENISNATYYSDSHDGLNKDVILTVLNNGAHWMLGAINLRSKTICLFDSKFYCTPVEEQRKNFECLLKIAHAVYATGSLDSSRFNWRLFYASDVPRQYDGTECGVNVCLMAYALLQNLPFPTTVTVSEKNHFRNRRWMLHVLESIQESKSGIGLDYRKLAPEVKKYVSERKIEFECDGIQIDSCVQKVIQGLGDLDEKWTICNASRCSGDIDHTDQQVLCVACREWYHHSCLDVVSAKLSTYFVCEKCSEHKFCQ